ncbi:MAG: bifunctional phosphopantothenoylcysteine decarboxylase/phosphopantothenate--cysteine ligase CoaBC [Fusobacteria bacterium]|nr:bifunctional phosphopantothenoylcysteine decarboxylase/phosphopantothenate--cysteine ligase CoaBC [Fusobacteriota bacterium]
MKNKNILIGITGGIAAYKIANLVSMLKKQNYNIDIIMTKNATEFITPLTFETLSNQKVVTDMFESKEKHNVEHISLAEKADFVLIAPATYNIIGKVASGIADDMLTTVIAATKAKVVFSIAMNVNMYENPILKENINKLKKLNYSFIDSDEGFLACGVVGKGRLAKEDIILNYINDYFNRNLEEISDNRVIGKKIVITAGRTEEPLDPVRYLSNRSTGKMGYELAKQAKKFGFEVTLIAGVVDLPDISGIKTIKVRSAADMYNAVENEYSDSDVLIMCAAVADYRIKNYSDQKIKKGNNDLILTLTRNPDILFEMGKRKEKQILVGFAAESENLIENAKDKLNNKNLDFIVGNDTSNFAIDTNEIVIIDKENNINEYSRATKEEVASIIIKKLIEFF